MGEGKQDSKQGTATPHNEEDLGKQARLHEDSSASWPKRLALALIRFYQNVISPRTPPTCFFYPTCSHYTYQAIEKFGFWRGVWLGFGRICRCHPFAQGGYDPLPQRFSWFSRRVPSHKDLDE